MPYSLKTKISRVTLHQKDRFSTLKKHSIRENKLTSSDFITLYNQLIHKPEEVSRDALIKHLIYFNIAVIINFGSSGTSSFLPDNPQTNGAITCKTTSALILSHLLLDLNIIFSFTSALPLWRFICMAIRALRCSWKAHLGLYKLFKGWTVYFTFIMTHLLILINLRI